METGRNEPCPCGSGKKHKKCCLAPDRPASDPVSLAWRKLNAIDDSLTRDLLAFFRRVTVPRAIRIAVDEYTKEEREASHPAEDDPLSFFPWLLYTWRPGLSVWSGEPPARELTFGEAYLARHGSRLGPMERRYLEANVAEPFSFYEVLSVEPGAGFEAEDFLRGGSSHVSERTASQLLQPGFLFWGKVVAAEGLFLLAGIGASPLRDAEKIAVIDLATQLRRRHRRVTTEVLKSEEASLRQLYLDGRSRQLNPRLPTLVNTDGEPLALHSLRFHVDDPHEAFETLAGLDAATPSDEVLAEAERDASGRVVKGTIGWSKPGNAMHRSWKNTVLGHLRIEGTSLVIEVNSNGRAEKIRAEVEKRLGKRVRYLNDVIQSPEKMVAERAAAAPDPSAMEKMNELMKNPAVLAAVKEKLEEHYRGWPDDRIPALGGKTPRQACRTADGRAKVEVLLRGAEERSPTTDPSFRLDLDFVRLDLGLPPKSTRRGP